MRALSSVAALAALVVGLASSAFASSMTLSSATLEFSFADVGPTTVAAETPGIPIGAVINIGAPLSIVGGGGSFQTTVYAITVTATGHGWTTGPAVITGLGSEFGTTVTISGYDNRNAAHAGAIQLVSPIRILTSFSGPGFPGYAAQTFVFVPEPGTLLLLGAGVACLGVIGLRRSRR